MNKRELDTIAKKAGKVANNNIDFVITEDHKGRVSNRGINVDGHIYWSVDAFYAKYAMTAPASWLESHKSDLLEHGWLYENGTLQPLRF